MDTKQLVTVAKAAKLCGITPRRLYVLLAEGRGPAAVEVAGRSLFLQDVVIQWNESRKATAKRKGKRA